MVVGMLKTGPSTFPIQRSVLIVSGSSPASRASAATRQVKLPLPWPTSRRTPRFLAWKISGCIVFPSSVRPSLRLFTLLVWKW